MNQNIKTAMISSGAYASNDVYLCGECFARLENRDKFCSSCGAEIGDEVAYCFEDLVKRRKIEEVN